MTADEPLDEEGLRAATVQLSIAMMRLGGEAPSDTYTAEGFAIWLRSVTRDLLTAYESHRAATTRDEREALRAENELLREMVALLTEAEERTLGYLAAHGWFHDPAMVQRGKEIRDALAALTSKDGDGG